MALFRYKEELIKKPMRLFIIFGLCVIIVLLWGIKKELHEVSTQIRSIRYDVDTSQRDLLDIQKDLKDIRLDFSNWILNL